MNDVSDPAARPYYELRMYQLEPGQVPEMQKRNKGGKSEFERLGIPEPLAYWESVSSPMARLHAYFLKWNNLDDRMAAFGRLYADSGWLGNRPDPKRQRMKRKENYILRPSTAWNAAANPVSPIPEQGVQELILQQVLPGHVLDAYDDLERHDLPCLTRLGATVLGVFDLWIGPRMPQIVILLNWSSFAACNLGRRRYSDDGDISAIREARQKRFGRPLFERQDVHIMRHAHYI